MTAFWFLPKKYNNYTNNAFISYTKKKKKILEMIWLVSYWLPLEELTDRFPFSKCVCDWLNNTSLSNSFIRLKMYAHIYLLIAHMPHIDIQILLVCGMYLSHEPNVYS